MRRLFVLAIGLLTGCATAPSGGLYPSSQTGSEMAAGGSSLRSSRLVRRSATANTPVAINLARIQHYRHPRAEAMLAEIMQNLLAAAAKQTGIPAPVSPQVSILDSSSYNAVLQNNQLYVTRGMLALMNGKAELAAVLAHELGHVIGAHPRQRVAAHRQAVASAMDVARTFGDPAVTRKAVEVQKRSLAAFSREQEYEADRIGIALMAAAGYDPQAAVRSLVDYERMSGLFGRLTGLRRRQTNGELASHPPTPERIARARAQANALNRRGRITDQGYLAAIAGLRLSGTNNSGFIRGRNFIHPASNVAITMPTGYTPLGGRRSIIGVRRGGSAFAIFMPMRADQALNPQMTVALLMRRISADKTPKVETVQSGAMGYASTAKGEQRVAIVRHGNAPYLLLMFTRKGYPGFDREFESTAESIRQLNTRDRAIGRPWYVKIVRASGPATLSRYASQTGAPVQLLLALNGLGSAAQVRAGMQLKVLAYAGAAHDR